MHSSDYQRLARSADGFSRVIVGFVELPREEGTYHSALCLLDYPDQAPHAKRFAVSLGVLPDDREDDAAFFVSTDYDMDFARALEVFQTRALQKCNVGAWA